MLGLLEVLYILDLGYPRKLNQHFLGQKLLGERRTQGTKKKLEASILGCLDILSPCLSLPHLLLGLGVFSNCTIAGSWVSPQI